jgi:hypothetical protein
MKEWLSLWTCPSVVKRALKYALIVGAVLITINHGDVLLRGEITAKTVGKMILTMCVPYVVSSLSSIGAMREKGTADSASHQGSPSVPH